MATTRLEWQYAHIVLDIMSSDRAFPQYVIYWGETDQLDWTTFQGLPSCLITGAVPIEKFDTASDDGLYDPETDEWLTPEEFVYAFDVSEGQIRDMIEDAKADLGR